MVTTNDRGNTVDDHGYYAYGRDRRGSELRTAQRFTGQQGDASGLIYMNARYYDPQIGQFLSPDTVVPDATNVFDYNRYMYARGNPMKYTDPSGYDPLDSAWETAFRGEHGRDPTDADRQARLYSLLYTGPVTGKQAWTSDDRHYFTENRASLFKDSSPARASLNDFAASIQTLGGFYSAGEEEQFVWAIALLYAGVPYGTQLRGVLSQGFGGARITVPGCNELLCLWLSHG